MGTDMYAAIVRLELIELTSVDEHGHPGRGLANLLSSQPGFLTFVAIDTNERETTAVYIFEDRRSLDAANDHFTQWRAAHVDEWECRVTSVSAGQIVAQKGL